MKYMTIFLLCLSLFGHITVVQAQKVVKDNAGNDYKTVDDNLLLQSKMRIAKIDSTLKDHMGLGGAILYTGVLALTSYDLLTNNHNISSSRRTWDWIGLIISAGGLTESVSELVEDNALKKERKSLDKICLQQQLKIDSQKVEIINWEKAKSINTLLSYQKYLDQYPTGRFINEAKAGMEVLLWKKYSSVNTVAAYIEYLNQYKSGIYVEEARNKIDEPIWRGADSLKSLTGYQNYLKLCPTGRYSKYALARILELHNRKNDYQLNFTSYTPIVMTINTYATSTEPSKSSGTVYGFNIGFEEVRPIHTPQGMVNAYIKVAFKVWLGIPISTDFTNGVLDYCSIGNSPITTHVSGINSAEISYQESKLPSEHYEIKFDTRNGLSGNSTLVWIGEGGDLNFSINVSSGMFDKGYGIWSLSAVSNKFNAVPLGNEQLGLFKIIGDFTARFTNANF